MTADRVIVGASFAGLACATAPARTGHSMAVLERKADPGDKLRTTGILVKDAVDQVPLLDAMPAALVRRVPGRFVAGDPAFRLKRVLRWVYDHFRSDWAFNLLLGSRAMGEAASLVYFHR